ncbi:MAG: flagellar brake protein [Sulfuricellaceae bacterium]
MSDDISRFMIASPTVMAQELNTLIKHQDFLTVTFNQGQDSFVTLLLEVSLEQGALIFDATSDQHLNQKLTKSTKNIFFGSPRGVKTQFTTTSAQLITHKGRIAFSTPLPDTLLRIQYREYFRASASSTMPLFCDITTPKGEKIRLAVDDLSVGGLGLLMPEDEYQINLREILQECCLDLKDFGMVCFNLEVRAMKPIIDMATGKRMIKMGCSFDNLAKQDQIKIQRTIFNLERKMMTKFDSI